MSNVKDLVNLNGEHMIEVVLHTPPEGLTTEQWYEKIRNRVMNQVMTPLMKEYLEGLRLAERLQEVKDMKTLEGTLVEYFPIEQKEALANTIDEFTELSDGQKVYLLGMFMQACFNSAKGYCDPIFRERAQEIIYPEGKRSSLITLN